MAEPAPKRARISPQETNAVYGGGGGGAAAAAVGGHSGATRGASSSSGTTKMHKDSKYRHYTPDFAALACQYPETFGPFVMYLDDEKTDAVIDWEDPKAARALTQTLLQHDFGLTWDIPLSRLCPPVPNRLNYICWLRDLLLLDTPDLDDAAVRGVDIGVGASAIYPLLGATVYGWSFLGTDIDPVALQAAQENIVRNQLEHRIRLKRVGRQDYSTISLQRAEPPAGPIWAALHDETFDTPVDFVMCNPPFFSSLEDIGHATPMVGCMDEMITPGGEVQFITAMLKDSIHFQKRVRWYTSMVGKKGTLKKVLALLREVNVSNVRTTEFLQGRTTRWGIAWSFTTAGEDELKNGGSLGSLHKVFGRKKMEKRREAIHAFLVKPSSVAQEEVLDEAVVLQRVVDYFLETRQANVRHVGVATGGAEELYRKVVLAELSSEGKPGGPAGGLLEAQPAVAATFSPISPRDPNWKKRCIVLVTVLAGAADSSHPSEEEQGAGTGEQNDSSNSSKNWVKVTVEMTSGGDRSVFWKVTDLLQGEVARTNRKWRRKLQQQAKGGGGAEMME